MSSSNEIIDFTELVREQEILSLKEKIEASHERLEAAESRVLKLEDEKFKLQLQLGKQSGFESLKTQHEKLKSQYVELRRQSKFKIDQLVERESRLKNQNDIVTQERNNAVDELTWTKDKLREQKLNLGLVKQELAQANYHCGRMKSECKEKLDYFDKCSEDYKNALFEKSVIITNLEQSNTELKEHAKELEKQRELAKAPLINIAGPDNNTSRPSFYYVQEYKKLGKYPENVYKEFHEINEKYIHLIEEHEQFSSHASRLQKELDTYKTQAQQSEKLASDRKTIAEQFYVELKEAKANHFKLMDEKFRLEQALQDTSYQLQYLIFDVSKRQDPIPAPVKQTANHLTNRSILTTHLPHEDLTFKNITDLQNLNQELSKKVRRLQLEHAENPPSARLETQSKANKLFDAKKQLAAIKEQLSESQKQNEILEQKLLTKPTPAHDDKNETFTSLFAEFQKVSESFVQYRVSTTSELALLQAELEKTGHSERELKKLTQSLQAENSMVQSQFDACQKTLEQNARELDSTRHQMAFAYDKYEDEKAKLGIAMRELNERVTSLTTLQLENDSLQAQYDAQSQMCDAIQQEMKEVDAERVEFKKMWESLNAYVTESEALFTDEIQVHRVQANELSGELNFAQETIQTLEKELECIEAQYKKSQEKVTTLKEKLAEYETREPETNIKKMSEFVPNQFSREEYDQLISVLNNKVAALEETNEEYVSYAEDVHKKLSDMTKEYNKDLERNKEYMRNLEEAFDERNQSLLASQEIAEKTKEEYDTMCENLKNAQDKLTAENANLKKEKRRLKEEQEAQKMKMGQLDLAIGERRSKHATMQEKATEDAHLYEKFQEEVKDSKQKLQDALNELALNKERYEKETTRWTQFQEDIIKYREEAEKNSNAIRDNLDDLIDAWTKAEGGDSHISELTNDMMSHIRQYNAVAIHKKEASDARYLEEYKKCKELQQEVACFQAKLDISRDTISELEKARKNKAEQGTSQHQLDEEETNCVDGGVPYKVESSHGVKRVRDDKEDTHIPHNKKQK